MGYPRLALPMKLPLNNGVSAYKKFGEEGTRTKNTKKIILFNSETKSANLLHNQNANFMGSLPFYSFVIIGMNIMSHSLFNNSSVKNTYFIAIYDDFLKNDRYTKKFY